MQRDLAYLSDILQAARLVQAGTQGITESEFSDDWMRQSAIIRQLEIIGEATKHLSREFKASHPEISWKSVAGMRDVLIHAYASVDLKEVWKAAIRDIPQLIRVIEPLLPLSGE
ncbi:MAG TPA: DUF86 domain-containing protein [Anaerolineae bacterium]|nr:DUF86 domain-containing protein [Anaerolineae bacterium]